MENYIIEGEVVDTYGGNFTYRDVWYEIEDGVKIYYEMLYGINICSPEEVEISEDEI